MMKTLETSSASNWVQYGDFISRDYEAEGIKFEQFINEYPSHWKLEELVMTR